MKRTTLTQYLYAIERDGWIKIGRSCDPVRRMSELSLKRFNPKLLIEAWSLTPAADERLLHWIFREYATRELRMCGEWFNPHRDAVIEVFWNLDRLRDSIKVPRLFAFQTWRYRRDILAKEYASAKATVGVVDSEILEKLEMGGVKQ